LITSTRLWNLETTMETTNVSSRLATSYSMYVAYACSTNLLYVTVLATRRNQDGRNIEH